jgi:hypothetical protein
MAVFFHPKPNIVSKDRDGLSTVPDLFYHYLIGICTDFCSFQASGTPAIPASDSARKSGTDSNKKPNLPWVGASPMD